MRIDAYLFKFKRALTHSEWVYFSLLEEAAVEEDEDKRKKEEEKSGQNNYYVHCR